MKIDIYSDIHLDSWLTNYSEQEIRFLPTKGTDLCLFAGDAGNGPDWYGRVIRLLKGKYKKVIGVPGNHDWYNSGSYQGLVDLNRHDPSNQVYKIGDKTIVTATLWTDFRDSESAMAVAERTITDFRAIPGMTGKMMKSLHYKALNFIGDCRADILGPIDVIMTHFAPIVNSVHPAYAGSSMLNPYFVNDNPYLVENSKPKLWVHGHTHKKFDYEFKGVRVVANPIGYNGEEQRLPVFEPKHVEI